MFLSRQEKKTLETKIRIFISLIFLAFFQLSSPLVLSSPIYGENISEREEFDFANGLFSRGMYDMAREGYKKFIESYPESEFYPEAEYMIGESLFMEKNYADSIEWFNSLIERPASNDFREKSLLKKGQAYYFLGDYEKSYQILSSLTESQNMGKIVMPARYYIAATYLAKGRDDEALEAFNGLTEEFKEGEYVLFSYMNMGDIYLKKNDYKNASSCFVKAASIEDKSLKARVYLGGGEAFYLDKNYEESADFFYKAIENSDSGIVYDKAALGFFTSLYAGSKEDLIFKYYAEITGKILDRSIKAHVLSITATSYLNKDNLEEAKKIFEKIVSEFPDTDYSRRAALNVCRIIYKNGNYPEAITAVDLFLRDSAEYSGEALLLKANILSSSGDRDGSIAEYKYIIDNFPSSEFHKEALYEIAILLDTNKMPLEAEKYYLDFVDKFGGDERSPEVLLKAAQNALRSTDYDKAIGYYRRFLTEYPDNNLAEKVIYQLGDAYIGKGDYNSAAETYKLFLKKFPDSGSSEFALYVLGTVYQELNEWDKSIEIFEKINPDKGGKYYMLGNESLAYSYYMVNDSVKAAETNYKIIAKDPEFILTEEAYKWTAEHYFNNNNPDKTLKVLKIYEKNFTSFRDSGKFIYMLGESLREMGSIDEAQTYFELCIDKNVPSPYFERSHLGMGRCHFYKKEYDKAIVFFEETINFNSDNMSGAYARFEIGNVKYALSEYEEAAKSYMMVAILYEDNTLSPEALFRAGESFEMAFKNDMALKAFQELINKYPENPLSLRAMERFNKNGKN